MISYEVRATGPLFERDDIAELFDREIQGELVQISSIGQRMVVSETPRGASGLLRGSVITELRGTPAHRGAAIASSQFYAPIVERGRRPGKRPPTEALVLWVVRKLGIVDRAKARGVAFAIARKIGRSGTQGSFMFFQAWQRLAPIAQQRWQAFGARIARELGGR